MCGKIGDVQVWIGTDFDENEDKTTIIYLDKFKGNELYDNNKLDDNS